MKRIFGCIVLMLALCVAFTACGNKAAKGDDADNSSITEGVGDASLDLDDIFTDDSQGGDSSSSEESSSDGGNDSSSSSSASSSEESSGSDNSGSEESSSNSSNKNSSIDYEDKSVWTDPVIIR